MKLTKYGHACIVLEEQGKRLVIDPGSFSDDFGGLENIIGVVFTHHHFDHFTLQHAQTIVAANPQAQFFGTPEVKSNAQGIAINVVTGGDSAEAGPFSLSFFGEMHAIIHAGFPPMPHNVGVLVNDNFYYPGDSFTVPEGVAVKTLGAPVSGPWLKVGETIDFVNAIKPQVCIPTHNALLTPPGEKMTDDWLRETCSKFGARYYSLSIGESLDI